MESRNEWATRARLVWKDGRWHAEQPKRPHKGWLAAFALMSTAVAAIGLTVESSGSVELAWACFATGAMGMLVAVLAVVLW